MQISQIKMSRGVKCFHISQWIRCQGLVLYLKHCNTVNWIAQLTRAPEETKNAVVGQPAWQMVPGLMTSERPPHRKTGFPLPPAGTVGSADAHT